MTDAIIGVIGVLGACWIISGMIGRADGLTIFLGYVGFFGSIIWFTVIRSAINGSTGSNSAKKPSFAVQAAIAARLNNTDPWERQFVARTMAGVAALCEQLAQQPLPDALSSRQLTPTHYLRLYKILFAYFWMTLFIPDRRAKSEMRRLLTRITDQNQEDTDRICDDLEVAFQPNDPEGPAYTMGKVAWSQIQKEVPTNASTDKIVALTLPLAFDSYRDSVRNMLSQ